MYDNVVRPVVDEVLQGYNCTGLACAPCPPRAPLPHGHTPALTSPDVALCTLRRETGRVAVLFFVITLVTRVEW